MEIPEKYFDSSISTDDGNSGSGSGSGGGTGYEDEENYTSTIRVENIVALDSKGRTIEEVTKDTPSFTVEVVYADMGLHRADVSEMRAGDMQAYYTGGAFEIAGSNKGSVRVVTDNQDYPRFRATFTGVTYTGAGKDFGFEVFYLLDGLEDTVAGEGKGNLYAAKPDEEDDEKKLGFAEPKIIISNYTYGNDTIVAGSEFRLDFTILNTSSQLPLENIVITLTPASPEAAEKGPGLLVASSSNTIYVPELAAGESAPYSVAFQARSDAEVTSHLINIRFSYEYIDTVLEERLKVADLTESIAIPVSQIDRFRLEPILDGIYAMPFEEAYLSVTFVNLGKSVTSNVSVNIRSENPAVTAPSEHYGNVEAGKSDTVDLYVTSTEPGEFTGEVVVQYEDENSNIKELTTPFTMYVEQPWVPPMEPEIPMDLEPETAGPPTLSLVLFIIGGLSIASPLSLYLMKRVKAKGSEDLDEIF